MNDAIKLQYEQVDKFRCPDGREVPVSACLNGCNHECLALSTRIMASKKRKWDGKTFSVTQLLQPTLQSYLKITQPETVSPIGSLAAALGTAGHALLEGNMPKGWIGEFRMLDKTKRISGAPDLIDPINGILYDFKFVAAFSVAKMMGMHTEGYWHEYQRGKRKGTKEWKQRWVKGGTPDYHQYDLQLNMYRLMLEEHGTHINKMILQVMAKESMKELQDLGLNRQAYLIEIPKYDDIFIRKYFDAKYKALKSALDTKTVPDQCNEIWNGRRCKDYCSVNEHCPYYKG